MRPLAWSQRDNPRRQIPLMAETFPAFTWRPNRQGGITWKGTLQPTAESTVYHVRIEHDDHPKVFVSEPRIQHAKHRYCDGSLCLYYPRDWQWSVRANLASSIVPWTALWLYFHETWLVTGEWLGPSSPHDAEKERSQ